jgi:HSP20 family molecular chaperone IbpA
MIDKKDIEVSNEETKSVEKSEQTRDTQVYVPRSDVYENEQEFVIVVDMPGVSDKEIDITLEKNVLTINGYVEPYRPEKNTLTYAEYGVGDFQRRFALPNEIDAENIHAAMKNGVLQLTLPKSLIARTRKITVKPG